MGEAARVLAGEQIGTIADINAFAQEAVDLISASNDQVKIVSSLALFLSKYDDSETVFLIMRDVSQIKSLRDNWQKLFKDVNWLAMHKKHGKYIASQPAERRKKI